MVPNTCNSGIREPESNIPGGGEEMEQEKPSTRGYLAQIRSGVWLNSGQDLYCLSGSLFLTGGRWEGGKVTIRQSRDWVVSGGFVHSGG